MTDVASRLFDNWQLKLLSVVFAVVLWVFVAAEDQGDAVLTVPLVARDVPAGTDVTLGTDTVEVRVQGFRHLLERVDERLLRAEVSLRGAQPGELVLRIPPDAVVLPRGLQVVRVSPARVRATVEPAARIPRAGGG